MTSSHWNAIGSSDNGEASRKSTPTRPLKRGPEAHAIGRSRGGLTTRIHAAVDALGLPVRFLITPGHWGDCPQARGLIEGLEGVGHVIADQYAMARRSGFDEVEISDDLAARQPEDQWLARADWRAHDYRAQLKA